jgi:hypothetical protein
MKSCTLFFLLFACTIPATAQFSVNEFIGSALNEEKVKSLGDQAAFLAGKPYRLSPLQRLEFRSQTPELDVNLNQYAIRLTPANPWELRSNNRYFSALASSLATENEIVLKEALIERYRCVIEYAYYAQVQSLVTEHVRLLNAQIHVLEKQSGSSFFDADEYLDLQVDILDEQVGLEEVELEQMSFASQAEILAGAAIKDSLQWTFSQLIPIESAKKIVDSLTASSVQHLVQRYQQQKIDLAKSEYQLEKTNINLGYVQTEFDNRRYDQNRTPINFSFGLTIPLTNPNKGDMAKRKLDIIDAQHDMEREKKTNTFEDELLQQKISRIIFRCESLKNKIFDLDNSALANTLSTIKGGDPRVVLRFQENKVKLKMMLAKLQRDLFFTYVDYLAFSDFIQQRPLKNFLSSHLEVLEN